MANGAACAGGLLHARSVCNAKLVLDFDSQMI